DRASLVFCFPSREDFRLTRMGAMKFVDYVKSIDGGLDPVLVDGASCVGADVKTSQAEDQVLGLLHTFLAEHYPQSQWEPDIWPPFVVRNVADIPAKLAAVAGDKYSYRELDRFTDEMEKALLATGRKDVNAPLVAKVDRSGILSQKIYLIYSQE